MRADHTPQDWLSALGQFAPLVGGVALRESEEEDSMLGSSNAGSRTVTLEDVEPPTDDRYTQTWTDVTPQTEPSQKVHYS